MIAAVGRWLALAAVAALAACSIEGRSADYACQGPADCPDGRICEAGWCVPGGDPASDAATGADDDAGAGPDAGTATADAAPAVCSEDVCDLCDNGTCVFLCIPDESCPGTVECPPGIPCRVLCDGDDSCASGVDCSLATTCDITCSDSGACAGPVSCGAGPCEVVCTGRDSCISGVDCSESCACATRCTGSGACALEPECPSAECVQPDDDCIGDGACDTCAG